MPFKARSVGLERNSSRCGAGVEKGRYSALCFGLVVCDLFYASIDLFSSSGVCFLDRDDVCAWVNTLPL